MQFFRNDKYIIMSRFFCENNIGTSTYHIYFVFVYLGIYSFKGTGIYLQTENILKMAHCVFYHTKNPFPLHVYKMVLAKKQWWGIIINKKKFCQNKIL